MKNSRDQFFLATSALAVAMLAAGSSFAQSQNCAGGDCSPALEGKALYNGSAGRLSVGENTERGTLADQSPVPFMISVDGEVVEKSGARTRGSRPVDQQRISDVALGAVDIQVKFDGLDQEPQLNVSTTPVRRSYRPGEQVRFLTSSNYPAFVTKAEIRILDEEKPLSATPVAIIPASLNAHAEWVMPTGEKRNYSYVLRVYDAKGRFDETTPLTIARTNKDFASAENVAVAPGKGEDRTAFRNIPVYGGAVTVYGREVPEGAVVRALGETVPIDPNGAFVTQRILPPGDHAVGVNIDTDLKSSLRFNRQVNIPSNEWFYVALADLTVGQRSGDDGIEVARAGEYDTVYTKGRLAFYLKGKIKGKYLLTAAADTREGHLGDLFKDLDLRDPRQLLRRIDPDKHYPVYGDDSTSIEDAPTNGKFYVRLERGDSHVMWGNYKTKISGTRFLQSDRGLYGANAVYRSEETTSFGARRVEATAYAAQPDTLPQRDEFLATGGSAYFLQRRDLTIGSETLQIEYRDPVSGRVVERRTLRAIDDYTIDYLSGVVILKRPLSSTSSSGAVRGGALGGHKVYLIAQYEFVPAVGDVDGYIYGGRAQAWLSEHVRVGVTGMNEKTGGADQRAAGADIQLRKSDTTYLNAEIAYSKGPGFGTSRSTDGGLTISNSATAGRRNKEALAWQVEGQVDLSEFSGLEGKVGGYYEEKQAGFSTISEQVTVDKQLWGVYAKDVALTDKLELDLAYDELQDGAGERKREGEAEVAYQLDAYWRVAFGVTYTDLVSPRALKSNKSGRNGSRLDAGARIDYTPDDDHRYYVFGQGTIKRSGDIYRNDRLGIGTKVQLTDKVGVEGEISYGTHGIGGLAGVTYDPTADDHYYLGYRLDPDRAFDVGRSEDLIGTDGGGIVAGVRKRMDDVASAYTESNYDMFGKKRSLTQTYGVIYTPDAMWTVDAGFNLGRVTDDRINTATGKEYSDFDRYAGSLAVGWSDEEAGIAARLRGEVRIERSEDNTRDRNTYLIAGGLSWKTSEDWRFLANIDAALSDAAKGSYYNGDFIEASLGYAYRPVDNDRFNALFKYTFLYDLPGTDQISGTTGDKYGPLQRSHILAADVSYDLLPWLTVGGKYAMRIGEARYRRSDGSNTYTDWENSSMHLGILRTDLHIVKNWDVLLEGRVLASPSADTVEYGALAAVYRHVGNNFKIGAGYNFGRFSDDLRDLTLDDRGWFLNVVGKF